MVTDTPETIGAASPPHGASARQQAWHAVQLGAQPLWQTAHQWTVAALLVGCIVIGCYTLLLTWPLTQNNAKVNFEGNCENRESQFHWYDRQIYGLVLEPCEVEETNPERTGDANAPAAQDDTLENQDTASNALDLPGSADLEDTALNLQGDEADLSAAAQPAQRPDPALDDNAQTNSSPVTKPAKPSAQGSGDDAEDTQEEKELKAFAASRQPNALFVAVLAAGLTGGAVYSLRSHTIHVARHSHNPSWGLWNLTRPFLGAALAVFLFFLIRAGFVQNSGSGSGALRPEGFIALGGLVGLFSDQAWARMRIIAESVFSPREAETRAQAHSHDRPGSAQGPGGNDGPTSPTPDSPPAQGGEEVRRPES